MLSRLESGYWKRCLDRIVERRNQIPNYNVAALRAIEQKLEDWKEKAVKESLRSAPERKDEFDNTSGMEIKRVYTPLDVGYNDYLEDAGLPGAYPYLRGAYPTMYRGRVWTMRQFSGYGAPEDTNKRLKYLLEHGETGLSIAFDMPTLYGYDADHPRALGEVGRCGVNVSSLRDMESIFKDIPLAEVSTSMTINAPAAVLLAMYVGVAEKQGISPKVLRGTLQADILKEYIAQKEWAFPPEAHLRIVRDIIVYCTQRMPLWHHISVSGYHIREAGATPLQELAFTLADGFSYIELGTSAGLKVDDFAPRLSFFFNCGIEFFEEIAKFRAARRIWARVLKERYGAASPRSLSLRFHTQTSGASLTWQQPMNNIVRTAIEGLAAVLGGTQSLHTNAYDEAWALPTEQAAALALRTQQIIAEETGVTDTIDPLGGSYYVEWLTDRMEEATYEILEKIESMGGILEAIKSGWIQGEIHRSAYEQQVKQESGDRIVVGVNKHVVEEEKPIEILRIDQQVQHQQIERLRKLRFERDSNKWARTLEELRKVMQNDQVNLIPAILESVKAYATLGEIMDIGREVYGSWSEPSIL